MSEHVSTEGMSDRRYGVYERFDTGDEWPLSSIPDALVEEAAKRAREGQAAWLWETNDDWLIDSRALARAVLSVLFPGEEE